MQRRADNKAHILSLGFGEDGDGRFPPEQAVVERRQDDIVVARCHNERELISGGAAESGEADDVLRLQFFHQLRDGSVEIVVVRPPIVLTGAVGLVYQ